MSATSALAPAPASIAAEPEQPPATISATAEPTSSEQTAAETATQASPQTENQNSASDPIAPGEVAAGEHEQSLERIRQSALPPALRDRLAAAVEAGKSSALSVEACLQAIEQSLPDFLRSHRENIAQPTHPSGNAFFQGADGELTDAEAEALAQRQLARSGLLRGQRVKVAD